nr:hypothetical protein [Pseudoxanthomonas taiwanensis]
MLAVESRSDLARAAAGQVLLEDAPHHRGLVRVDFALPGAHHPVAVGQAASAGPCQGPAGQATMGLVGQVVQVQLRHQRPHADIELVRSPVGVHAVADGDQPRAVELHSPHGVRQLRAVPAQAGEVIDQDHVEQMRVGQQGAVTGTVVAGAADRRVGVGPGFRPALAPRVGAAVAQLVVDGSVALVVAAVTGVGGYTHGVGC